MNGGAKGSPVSLSGSPPQTRASADRSVRKRKLNMTPSVCLSSAARGTASPAGKPTAQRTGEPPAHGPKHPRHGEGEGKNMGKRKGPPAANSAAAVIKEERAQQSISTATFV